MVYYKIRIKIAGIIFMALLECLYLPFRKRYDEIVVGKFEISNNTILNILLYNHLLSSTMLLRLQIYYLVDKRSLRNDEQIWCKYGTEKIRIELTSLLIRKHCTNFVSY